MLELHPLIYYSVPCINYVRSQVSKSYILIKIKHRLFSEIKSVSYSMVSTKFLTISSNPKLIPDFEMLNPNLTSILTAVDLYINKGFQGSSDVIHVII